MCFDGLRTVDAVRTGAATMTLHHPAGANEDVPWGLGDKRSRARLNGALSHGCRVQASQRCGRPGSVAVQGRWRSRVTGTSTVAERKVTWPGCFVTELSRWPILERSTMAHRTGTNTHRGIGRSPRR